MYELMNNPHANSTPLPTPKTKETTNAALAVRAELERVIKQDPFGIAELVRIAEIATAGKQLLTATSGDAELLAASRTNVWGVPMAPGVYSETFGAKALREVTASMNGDTAEKIIRAIAVAKDAGLDDIAADLTVKLRATLQLDEPKTEQAASAPPALPEAATQATTAPTRNEAQTA